MKLGAERKKVAILVALIAVAAVIFMINSTSDVPSSPQVAPQASRTTPAPAAGPVVRPERQTAAPAGRGGRGGTEFRPSVRPRRGEERDPSTIDPTLRLDFLAKLQGVTVEGTRRSIFDFSQPPPPKPDPKQVAEAKPPVPSPLAPDEKKSDKPAEPEKPKAPPIPLKFYGYLSRTNVPAKRAFFMDGDEIHIGAEGDLLKKRYKIVRIGVNSAVVEDTQFGQEQTLPLEEQPG
jgi:hypothetical protein